MKFTKIENDKKKYMDLLFLADEDEDMIDKYIDEGDMYILEDPDVVGECVVVDLSDGVFEIKNIATNPDVHGKGYGRALIDFVMDKYADRCKLMLVGTGDSPLTVPFYEKCGFRRHHVIKNFFIDNYDHEIIEEGVKLVDMVYLARTPGLKEGFEAV